MKVAIIQPSYFPWRGYFSIMASVDIFVFLDDVQYTRRDWRNRNKFEINKRIGWLTIPIKSHDRETKINKIEINSETNWQENHLQTFQHNYSKTQFFEDANQLFAQIRLDYGNLLSNLTIETSKSIAKYLNLKVEFFNSSNLGIECNSPSERLANITSELGGNFYLSGPSAVNYLDLSYFEKRKIEVCFKEHSYIPYPRTDHDFLSQLSILDLISFHGTNSNKFL